MAAATLLPGMAADSTRISGRTWRRIGGLAAAGLVLAALGSNHSGHSAAPAPTSPGPSSYSAPVGAAGPSGDPAADLQHQQQAVQALQEGSQETYGAAMNSANSLTP